MTHWSKEWKGMTISISMFWPIYTSVLAPESRRHQICLRGSSRRLHKAPGQVQANTILFFSLTLPHSKLILLHFFLRLGHLGLSCSPDLPGVSFSDYARRILLWPDLLEPCFHFLMLRAMMQSLWTQFLCVFPPGLYFGFCSFFL